MLHSCAGALSQPAELLCLRKEGSPALLPSTGFQPSPPYRRLAVHVFFPNTQVHPSRGELPETPAFGGSSLLAGQCLTPPSPCSPGRLQSMLMLSVPPPVPACCSSAWLPSTPCRALSCEKLCQECCAGSLARAPSEPLETPGQRGALPASSQKGSP